MLACRSRNVLNLSLCLVLSASLSGLPAFAEGPGTDLATLEGRIVAYSPGMFRQPVNTA